MTNKDNTEVGPDGRRRGRPSLYNPDRTLPPKNKRDRKDIAKDKDWTKIMRDTIGPMTPERAEQMSRFLAPDRKLRDDPNKYGLAQCMKRLNQNQCMRWTNRRATIYVDTRSIPDMPVCYTHGGYA